MSSNAGKTILIVEDDQPSREVVRLACSAQNHTLIEAGNGTEGLEMARESSPDLVIPHSESLDRAANAGRPLVTSDPGDPVVADVRILADAIRAAVPA